MELYLLVLFLEVGTKGMVKVVMLSGQGQLVGWVRGQVLLVRGQVRSKQGIKVLSETK